MLQHAQTLSGPASSLIADTSRICDQLTDILARVVKLGDALHGPEPREASAAPPPSPVVSQRHEINRADGLAASISMALGRIESRL